MSFRIGLGFDSHRLAAGGPMRLGGVEIPSDLQLIGHSDADVLLHAITDALLGAAGIEDIGQLFPDTAAENKNRDSAEMLSIAWRRVASLNYRLVNLDCVVCLERPKILPYKQSIRQRIASLLEVEVDCISLKGKTGEGTGEIGQSKLAQAHCVALLERAILP